MNKSGPGVITTGSLSLAGTTLMEIDGVSTPGVDYDAVNVSGLLTYGGSMLIDCAAGLASPLLNGTASVNDVLRLTAADPFTSPLAGTNVVNVYFDVVSLANGDTFLGGFYIDNPSETAGLLASEIGAATYQYFVKGSGSGSFNYNGTNYYSFEQFAATASGITGVTRSVVNVASADFASGTVFNGQVTQFVIIPEPTSMALAGIGIAAAAWAARRRGR